MAIFFFFFVRSPEDPRFGELPPLVEGQELLEVPRLSRRLPGAPVVKVMLPGSQILMVGADGEGKGILGGEGPLEEEVLEFSFDRGTLQIVPQVNLLIRILVQVVQLPVGVSRVVHHLVFPVPNHPAEVVLAEGRLPVGVFLPSLEKGDQAPPLDSVTGPGVSKLAEGVEQVDGLDQVGNPAGPVARRGMDNQGNPGALPAGRHDRRCRR